ncbi:MAG: recombinase family protein [Clostridia bacterium]|nr:recombinase family protein [Clostridia bacterium]
MQYENNTTYKTAIYCRLSKDDEQVGDSVSIETQKMLLTDYCIEHGFEIYDIYVDDGFSGLNFNRPAFMRILNDIDAGNVNLVITKDLSRLGRDYIQTGYFTDVYFPQKRIRYIAVNDGIDTSRNDNDIAPFKNILNDMYAKDLSRKVKMARRQRALKGYYMSGQAPFGYKQDPNDRNHLIVDEEAAEVVKMIFKLAQEGESFLAIARKLTELGILTPSAHKVKNGDTRFIKNLNKEDSSTLWSYVTVSAMLSDSVYRGDMVNHKTEIINYKTKQKVSIPREDYIIVPNRHEAIIDNETFEKVQQILQARKYNKRHNFENVFKGLVYCAECGTAMTLIAQKTKKGEKRGLFKCFKHYEEPEKCKHYHVVIYNDLYDEVLTRIKLLFEEVKNSQVYESLRQNLIEHKTAEMAEQEKEEIFKELSFVKKSISEIRKASDKGNFNSTANSSLLNDLIARQRELAQRLAMVECGETDYNVDENEIDELLNNFLNIEKLDDEIVSKLIKKIEVGEAVVTEDGPYRDIAITYSFDEI